MCPLLRPKALQFISWALFPCLLWGQPYPVEYNPKLHVNTRAGLEKSLRAPFARDAAPAHVANCLELLSQKGHQPQPAAAVDFQAQRATTAACLVLDELKRAKPSRVSFLRTLPWDANTPRWLPPQLTITASDEMARKAATAAANGQTYADFDPAAKATAKAPDELDIAGQAFSQSLTLWGRGDFNGDGVEDMLVQANDALTGGTYRAIRLYELTRLKPNAPLSVLRQLL